MNRELRTLAAAALLALLAVPAAAGTVAIPANKDSTLHSENGTLANGAGDYFFTGVTALGAKRRALILFDVANSIPAGSTIVSAALVLNMSQTAASAVDVKLHRVLASWGEGASNPTGQEGAGAAAQPGDATWTARFFPGTPWTTPGGDYVATPSAVHSVDQGPGDTWNSLGMANDVQGWLNAPSSNFGWIVIGDETQIITAKRFDSRTNPTPANRPVLIVDFTPPLVPANYCTATANSTGFPGQLSALNAPSLANGMLQLAASQLPPNTNCSFFFGTERTETPLGNGNLCVAGSMYRLGTSTASPGGVATRNALYGLLPVSVITPGSTWCFQAQYRNVAAGGAGFNQTNGLAVTFGF
ncbi:MAG: DNRLRE domain-containing protein [Planctomycetes bacterium]|nr:DNRLRE domain-containing protein [Planctomycetota bacterium]